MAMAAILAASVLLLLTGESKGNPHVKHFWRPALSCTLASPFGCKFVSSRYTCCSVSCCVFAAVPSDLSPRGYWVDWKPTMVLTKHLK